MEGYRITRRKSLGEYDDAIGLAPRTTALRGSHGRGSNNGSPAGSAGTLSYEEPHAV